MPELASSEVLVAEHRARVTHLEATLAFERTTFAFERAKLEKQRDDFKRLYEITLQKLELLSRRIFAAKAERIDTTQLDLEFAALKAELEALTNAGNADADADAGTTMLDNREGAAEPAVSTEEPDGDGQSKPPPKRKPTPHGRRDLASEAIPEERIELRDEAFETQGLKAISFEESSRLGYRTAGPVRIVIARAIYKVAAEECEAEPKLVTVAMPAQIIQRGLLAPSLMAHILVSKFAFGLPFHRQCAVLSADGVRLDRSTMCRMAEDVGATLGAVVEAMAAEAMSSAFCLATDATGVCIQPTPIADSNKRQACRKGHFFVVLADQDHVFFEFKPKQSSAAVCEMFRGFGGYIQADAHAVFDALFRGEARLTDDAPRPLEVACYAHMRRRFWEAATAAKDRRALEALFRIRMLYALEARWTSLPPKARAAERELHSRPLVDAFFAWARPHYDETRAERSLVASAFGYAIRQEAALRRFLDDGRLRLDNNPSENALRVIAVGRNAWLFFGSDDHAGAAANIFSLIASCKLHAIEPRAYLAELIHVMPLWPRDRYIELAPKYWRDTRARLRDSELTREYGPLTIPPPLTPPAKE